MKLASLKVLDIRKAYIDNIEEWIEVPVWDQEQLIALVNEINWENLSLTDYKRILAGGWPGLSVGARKQLRENPAARDEFYEMIVKDNWGLRPGAYNRTFYNAVELENVRLWFATIKAQGTPPEVL